MWKRLCKLYSAPNVVRNEIRPLIEVGNAVGQRQGDALGFCDMGRIPPSRDCEKSPIRITTLLSVLSADSTQALQRLT